MVASDITSISCHFPFFTAAKIPMGTAASITKIMVIPPSFADTGKPFLINSLTSFPVYFIGGTQIPVKDSAQIFKGTVPAAACPDDISHSAPLPLPPIPYGHW